jgi:uncharacterized protein
MMGRWWFAIQQGFLNRRRLKAFLEVPILQIGALSEITLEKIEHANVAILVLDFDGVLASHDEPIPSKEAQAWLQKISAAMGEQRIVILTNKPKPERLAYFATHFPLINVWTNGRKKPYPDGLLDIMRYKAVAPHRVLLVDDRLLTGMLATCLSCCQGWYFTKPRRCFWRRPIRESFFSFLRFLERCVVRLMI